MPLRHGLRLSARRKRPCIGAALIIVLCFVVLLTILILAFLNHSQTTTQIINARSAGVQVDVMARTALELTKADLRQEIISGSTNNAAIYTINGTNAVYVPSTNLTVVPSRTGFTSQTPGSEAVDNIVKISKYGTNFFGPASLYNPSYLSPAPASAVSTSAPALNGRYIDSWTTTGWDKPQLVDTTLYNTSSLPVPDWIYVTTDMVNGPRKVLTAPTADVVGRYAFVIYDEGGLLDANVAGYPSTISSPDARDPQRKGPLALADLSQIPGGINANSLIAWRNAATSASGAFSATTYPATNSPDYLKYVYNGSLNRGGAAIYPGDQKFLSRQDLIAYSAANPTILPPESLAYLATFTRTLNAPTWTPTTQANSTFTPAAFTYESKAEGATGSSWAYNVDSINTRWPANVTITRPKLDDDTGNHTNAILNEVVPTETITFHQGDPVIQHRFPLSKIALLANPGAQTSNPATVGSVAWAVNYYFGLTWVASDAALAEPHWQYTHETSGASLANGNDIHSIPEVAFLKTREPDFFEMLRQGVLKGAAYEFTIYDMGASIIDQFDADDQPTAITTGGLREAFGKENLPYLSQLLFWPYRVSPASDPLQITFEAYLVPMLWNPHRNAATRSTTVTNFQIYLAPGVNQPTPIVTISGVKGTGSYTGAPLYPVSTSGLVTSTNAFTTIAPNPSYQEPTILSGATVIPSTATGLAMSESPQDRSGFYLGSVPAPDNRISGGPYPTYNKATIAGFGSNNPISFTCALQCQYPDNTGTLQWHTYENLEMNVPLGFWNASELSEASGNNLNVNVAPSFSGASAHASYSKISQGPVDPRVSAGNPVGATRTFAGSGGITYEVFWTSSLGNTGTGATWRPVNTTAQGDLVLSSPVGNPTGTQKFGWFPNVNSTDISPASGALDLGAWSENNNTSNFAYYQDDDIIANGVTGDRVQRPGDGAYGAFPMASSGTYTTVINDRPIILNRPFRSVGELGYAYRGVEWRTIDFCSAVSADSGLLDLFSIGDSQKVTVSSTGTISTPLTAGVVSINTRHPEVLKSLLSGTLENDLDTSAATVLPSAQVQSIATAIVAETSNMSTGHGPLINRSDIVNRLMNLPNVTTALSGTVSKPQRESVVRALAEPADTRTWNLLIDLVVQAGHYPNSVVAAGTTSSLSQFDVEGERRYWLHLAIDRYTGKIIDEQLEVINDN